MTQVDDRVLLAIDLSCYYVQVAEKFDPSLKGKPVGIRQRDFIASTNYVARSMGASKCGNKREILAQCPQIVLVTQNMQVSSILSVVSLHFDLFAAEVSS